MSECTSSTSSVDNQRIAIVTGGSRGIGAAVCKKISEEFKDTLVVVNYRDNMESALKVCENINSSGGKAVPIQADVSDPSAVLRLFEEVDHLDGYLCWLVNNAGIIGPRGNIPLADLSPKHFEDVMRCNTLGPLLCIQQAEKRMSLLKNGKGGAIVNISSGSAYIGQPVLYSASKAALNSLQIGLVPTLCKQGIRINTVSPGLTETDMTANTLNDSTPVREQILSTIPMSRAGVPEEIASAVVFLLDNEKSSYTAGANIRVSGGRPPGTVIG